MSNTSIKADILAKLLLVQSTVDTLPDSEDMVLFLRRAMEETPGVSDIHLSVDGKLIPPSDTIEKRLAEHEAATDTTETDNILYAPLRTARVDYGHLVLSLNDAEAFAPYRDFMLNIASDIAMSMENRDHIRQINEVNAALERRVEKRTAALKEREEIFRAITSAAQDAIIMMDRDGKIASWNQAAERIFGHTAQEAMGRELHALIAPKRFHERALRGIVRYRETGESPVAGKTIELVAVQKDGSEFPIELSLSTVQLRGKWHAIGIVRNISERKNAESTQLRINHALETISSCNSVLVHADNETELLTDMCRVIVDVGSFRMAWVGFAEHDKAKTVRPVAHYGHESDYLKKAGITWADTDRGRGPTGTVIRTGEIQTNQDFENNPQMQPWREAALKRGYRSSIALPLENSGDVFGALTIY
ncbi:MAG TPA: PAS domain S-box protein, partial [Mariprofundaceae bacterium]|nr:PAS domain S-box protein [Mariprofundaceae bacterium]